MWVLFVVLALVAVAAGVAAMLRQGLRGDAVAVRAPYDRDRSADHDDGIEYDDDVAYDVVGEAALRRADATAEPSPSATAEATQPGTNGVHAATEPPAITWPQRFDARVGDLDDEARIRLLGDLAIVRAAWCLPILELATREETAPAVLAAAQAALASSTPGRATEGAGASRR